MSVSWRSFENSADLSDEFGGALRRRLTEIGGIVVLALAAALAVALATWSVQDPSLTHATKAPVRNLLGLPGAISADLLMQIFGLASIALLFPVAVWGWRLLSHRALDREKLRLLLWVVGALAAAAFASCLPKTVGWPLPTGLGGVIGDAMLRVPGYFGLPLSGSNRTIIAFAAGSIAVLAMFAAAGFGWRGKDARRYDGTRSRSAPTTRSAAGSSAGWRMRS